MRKKISCFECRRRKTKCDLNEPCLTCKRKNIKCVYPQVDERTLRKSVSELKYYKKSTKRLETILNDLKRLRHQPDKLLEYLDEYEPREGVSQFSTSDDEGSFDESLTPIMVPAKDHKSSMVFGPASVYKQSAILDLKCTNFNEEMERETNSIGHGRLQLFELVRLPKSSFDSAIYDSITSFFMWQYPSIHLFIHRESFLFHFLKLDFDNTFVSNELIFSMAALGAGQSSNDSLRVHSEEYSELARSLLFRGPQKTENMDFSTSSLTKLQSLLCLALYDIIQGKLTSGWLLSGLAFRMCSDLGFEWDPSRWSDDSKSGIHPNYPFELNEVKRRIYWGCFIADHFLSLLLGRQPMLRKKEANVSLSKDLYDLANIEEFLYLDEKVNSRYNVNAAICTEELVKLIEIGESMLFDVFGPMRENNSIYLNKKADVISRLKKLDLYNSSLTNWKISLSKEIGWTESSLVQTGYNYIALAPRAYYFLLRLSLNRPFISFGKVTNSQLSRSVEICERTIIELRLVLQSITDVYGSKNFKPIMPLVYSIVLATSVLAWKCSIADDEIEKLHVKESAGIFLEFLRISAYSFKIAEDALNSVQKVFHEVPLPGYNNNSKNEHTSQNVNVQQPEQEAASNNNNHNNNIKIPFSSLFEGDIFASAFRPDSAILDWELDCSENDFDVFNFLETPTD